MIAYQPNDDIQAEKWLITSATVNDETKQLAEKNNIQIMEGEELVEWIADCLPKLSAATKQTLGIIEIPQVIRFDSY